MKKFKFSIFIVLIISFFMNIRVFSANLSPSFTGTYDSLSRQVSLTISNPTNALIIVAAYNDSNAMLSSKAVAITPNTNVANVDFQNLLLPSYFSIKVFILDSFYRPLQNAIAIDINRNTEALAQAKILFDSTTLASRDWITRWLTDVDLFTESEAQYAIEHCNVDWKQSALAWANEYSGPDHLFVTPRILKEDLLMRSYTSDEVNYAITNCDIDWNERALHSLQYIYPNTACSRTEFIYCLMEYYDFSQEQATYAIQNGSIDWNYRAYWYLERYFNNIAETEKPAPTAAECNNELLNAGFTASECRYALSQYFPFAFDSSPPPYIDTTDWVSLKELQDKTNYSVTINKDLVIIFDPARYRVVLSGFPSIMTSGEIYGLECGDVIVRLKYEHGSNNVYGTFKLNYDDLVAIGVLL